MFYSKYHKDPMKIHAIPLPLAFIFIFFALFTIFLPQEVRADSDFSECDVINQAELGGPWGNLTTVPCRGSGTISQGGTVYGVQVYINSSDETSYVWVNDGTTDHYTGATISAQPNGYIDIYFPTPIEIPSGVNPYIIISGSASSITGVNTFVNGYPYTSFNNIYRIWYWSGEPPSDTSTRIEWVNPPITTPSATTSSSTIDFEFNYYLNSNDSDIETFTHILLQLYPLSYPNDPAQRITVATPLVADSWENVSVEVETNKLGYYMGIVSFWNGVEETQTCNWWDIFTNCEEATPVVGASFSNKFNVATTTIPADAPPFIVQGMDSICNGIDSDFFGIDTLMCKTISFLFMPSENTFTEIQLAMNSAFRNNLPFSTFYQFNTKITEAIDTEGEAGSDVVLHLPGISSGSENLTVFSYAWARTFMEGFDSGVGNIIVWCEWIFFTILSLFVLFRPKES